jgi:transcriptional regulator NrdR family protein
MANFVIKKSGEKQPFDERKLKDSIRSAAKEAGIEENKIEQIVNEVGGQALELAASKEEIATSELKEKILSTLDATEPSVSAVWRKHDSEKKS